jgi:hypothetical protein
MSDALDREAFYLCHGDSSLSVSLEVGRTIPEGGPVAGIDCSRSTASGDQTKQRCPPAALPEVLLSMNVGTEENSAPTSDQIL